MASGAAYSRRFWQNQLAFPLSKRAKNLLVYLLSVDALFITIHMLILAFRYFGVVAESDIESGILGRFDIERDRGSQRRTTT